MLRGFSFGLVLVYGVLAGVALCQSPPTMAESLLRYGVSATGESLVAALKNPNASVRGMAAMQLAADKAVDAIPAIADALAAEKESHAHMSIAFALAQFGDERGFAALKTACDDPDSDGFVRARSTWYLLELHRDSCPNAVLDLLQSASAANDGSRLLAFDLVADFEHYSDSVFEKMFQLVLRALDDQDATARLLASQALGRIGDPSAIPYLQGALAVARSDSERASLQDAIEAIRKKQAEKALFDRGTTAMDAGRFDVAKLTFQTLINTYPGGEYARKAGLALEDPRLANCGESVSFVSSACDTGERANAANK